MAVSTSYALEIVKYLPHKNCGDCGEPLCISFASKLIGGKKDIKDCPHLTLNDVAMLEKLYQPPVKEIKIGIGNKVVSIGGERVSYRHMLRFFNPTAIAIIFDDSMSPDDLNKKLAKINNLIFERVGEKISINLIAIRSVSKSPTTFANTVKNVKSNSNFPLALFSYDPIIMAAGLDVAGDEKPLICMATPDNWKAMADLAKKHNCPLAVEAQVKDLENLISKIESNGFDNIVLAPKSISSSKYSARLEDLAFIRNMAISERKLGYPTMAYPTNHLSEAQEIAWASAGLAKYASLVFTNVYEPYAILPLLTFRQNIFSDPTVPATVNEGLYIEGKPNEKSPVMLTVNFAMTYAMVSADIRSANISSYILVANSSGYAVGVSVLLKTVTGNNVAALIDSSGLRDKVKHGYLIIPGLMEPLKKEFEDATKREVLVGPIDSRFIPRFMSDVWNKLPV